MHSLSHNMADIEYILQLQLRSLLVSVGFVHVSLPRKQVVRAHAATAGAPPLSQSTVSSWLFIWNPHRMQKTPH